MEVGNNPYVHIERVGRICYKSEDAITESSAEPFCRRLFNCGHHAMIEHYRFIVEVSEYIYSMLVSSEYSKYLTFTEDNRYVISASARGFNDMYNKVYESKPNDDLAENIIYCLDDIVNTIIEHYKCPELFNQHYKEMYEAYDCARGLLDGTGVRQIPVATVIEYFDLLSETEYGAHAWYSVHIVCDRGVTHELVRHRDMSPAQESTRYCNYSKGKYGSELTFIKPLFWAEDSEQYKLWQLACKYDEKLYKNLINMGATPQEARSILPNSLKSEIVITAQVYEWIHIFNLRVLGTTGAPHPQMKEVMEPVYKEIMNKVNERN